VVELALIRSMLHEEALPEPDEPYWGRCVTAAAIVTAAMAIWGTIFAWLCEQLLQVV
jgi:hypothetical protein